MEYVDDEITIKINSRELTYIINALEQFDVADNKVDDEYRRINMNILDDFVNVCYKLNLDYVKLQQKK